MNSFGCLHNINPSYMGESPPLLITLQIKLTFQMNANKHSQKRVQRLGIWELAKNRLSLTNNCIYCSGKCVSIKMSFVLLCRGNVVVRGSCVEIMSCPWFPCHLMFLTPLHAGGSQNYSWIHPSHVAFIHLTFTVGRLTLAINHKGNGHED